MDDPNQGIPIRERRGFGHKCTHSRDGERCDRKHYCRGLCRTHYMRSYRTGDPGPVEIRPPRGPHLDHTKALVILRMVSDGTWTHEQAAVQYGVSITTVEDIVNGRTWCAIQGSVSSDS